MKTRILSLALAALVWVLGAARAESRVIALGDYRAIGIEKTAVEVTDAELEEQIDVMLGMYAAADGEDNAVKPELTDAFAKAHLAAASAEEYKARLRGILLEEKKESAQAAQKEAYIAELNRISEVELDESEWNERIESYKRMYRQYAAQMGISWAEFARTYYALDEETFNQAIAEQAAYDLRGEILLNAVAEEMGLSLSDEEFAVRRDAFYSQYGLTEQTARERYPDQTLRGMFLRDLLWEHLLEEGEE